MILAFRKTAIAAALALSSTGCSLVHNLVATEKRDVYRFQPKFAVSDPQFRRSLDAMGSVMIGGNSAELLENGDRIFPAMERDIHAAKTSVNMESYIFVDDEAGRQVAAALMDASRRGVEVRLLVDAVGGKLRGLWDELKSAHVNGRKYRPIRLYSIYKIGKRTHRKLLVVDGRIGYTGGVGIDHRWLGNARGTKEWRDTMVRVEGPVVAQMQSVFSEDWTYTTGEILAGDAFYPKLEPAGPTASQAVRASRGDASSMPKMLYYMAIQAARKSIHIENAYFIPDRQVRDGLVAAVGRGVDVAVIVPGTHIDLPMIRLASRLHYGKLLKAGVKIYEYEPTMNHNKTMVVDGIFSTIGSINFDTRSMAKNAEESLAFYDRPFAEKMEEMFQRDLTSCRQVTYRAWDRRGLLARSTEMISWIWEPFY